ncbi:MAG TPA: DMT family transporter [Longimicrobiales bacterium]|nr:DMT family transporter [Longimicrobiales bacterium]
MQTLPTLLVLASAALHAYWNFLLKRAGGGQLVVGLSKVAEAVLLAPVVAGALVLGPDSAGRLLLLASVGAGLVGANYALLAAAYRRSDLSFVYPVSRGTILVVLPVAGWLVFAERLSAIGGTGLALIVGGIALQLARAGRDGSGTVLALGAGTVAAGYTLWDKHAVQRVAPPVYFAAYSLLVGIAYATFIVRRYDFDATRTCWRAHARTILRIGLANSVGYLLVLFALRSGVSSYVIGLRQASIAFGAVLGWRLLGERPTRAAWAGIALVVAGCLLVALAPVR